MGDKEIAGAVVKLEIAKAIAELEDDRALELVQQAVDKAEIDALDLLQNGVMAGLREIGDRFGAGEYFLAELVLGGDLVDQCIKILDPHLPEQTGPKRGIVAIAAVKGDLHSIGVGIVAKQLELAGYEVHNLGVDVPSLAIINKAKELKADIIGLSAFLVTTVPCCKEVIDCLRDMNLRNEFKVLIGGAETSQQVADTIGADGWAPDAIQAVKLCDRTLGLG